MKIGIVLIPRPLSEAPPSAVAPRTMEIAAEVERLGFAGLWVTDALGRGWPTLDPLVLLAAAASATHRIELGTCILQVPLRHPVELAHRVQSLDLLCGGRLRLGVGSGSTRDDFDALQADYDGRFKALPAALETMRRVWRGEPVHGPALSPWPGTEGGPPMLLGAWHSPRWIGLAAQSLQGWIASGIHSRWEDVEAGARLYRDAGGARTVVANIFTDLRPDAEPSPLAARARISLFCTREVARERLARLADLGVDDALLVCPFDAPEQLAAIAELRR